MKMNVIIVVCSQLAASLFLAACGTDSPADGAAASDSDEPLFVTSTIVFGDEGSQSTYVSTLASLDAQALDLGKAREFSGWSGTWARAGKLFVSDGEAPTMARYSVSDQGAFGEEGKLSFLGEGARSADSVFVSADKAYVFANDVTVWNPRSLEIVGRFEPPAFPDRAGGLRYSGLLSGRQVAVRDHRVYVATHWANWDVYDVAEDSLIVVIDSDKDEVIATLPVDCPYLDSATIDEDGVIYFSNWVYSLAPTLLHGKRKACAVRLLPGEDQLDDAWSLTFADVTNGREGASLRSLGNHQALMSVYHHEEVDLEAADVTTETLADSAHWRFWTLDLETLEAQPVTSIGAHAGGFATARVDERNYVLVPSDSYESTSVYELDADGKAELRWTSAGWSTELARLR